MSQLAITAPKPFRRPAKERVIKGLKAREMFVRLAETFQALGDTSRVQIIWVLSHGELSVGDLAKLVSMNQSSVSHHLRTIRNLRLVKTRRSGRTIFYSLDDEHIERLLAEGIRHVKDFL